MEGRVRIGHHELVGARAHDGGGDRPRNTFEFKLFPAAVAEHQNGWGGVPDQQHAGTVLVLEGSQDFPEYERVIPDEKKLKTVIFEKAVFQSMLRRIALFVTDRYNKVKFNFTQQRLTITVSTPDVGEAQEKLAVEYAGDEQNLAFNPEFLLEFLQRAEGEKIVFGFSTETKPVLLRPEADADFLYVAMPLKLD